jgi:hypothetical protein
MEKERPGYALLEKSTPQRAVYSVQVLRQITAV